MTSPQEPNAGSDRPDDGSTGRPAGTVDEDANPPLSDPEDGTEYPTAGTESPKDTESPVPPYEGRT